MEEAEAEAWLLEFFVFGQTILASHACDGWNEVELAAVKPT